MQFWRNMGQIMLVKYTFDQQQIHDDVDNCVSYNKNYVFDLYLFVCVDFSSKTRRFLFCVVN